jgi:hypothetical protein
VSYDFSHVCPKGLKSLPKHHDGAPLCGGVLPPHCETKWWCCVYKKKEKKKRKEGKGSRGTCGKRWLYYRWKKSVRCPPVTGCSGDGHDCVTLFVIVCFVCAAMMIVTLKYKQEASGRVCILKNQNGHGPFH